MQEAGRDVFDGGAARAVSAEETRPTDAKSWLQSAEGLRYVYGAAGFVIIAAVFRWLQFSTNAICCGDYDGYYHIRWSSMLWDNFSQGKWLPEFTNLPLTVLSPDTYADHHFLFHVLQIPFLWFFEPVMAAKVAAVVFATAAVFSCFWLILRYRVSYPFLWLLALLGCASPFYYRMNMAKAPPFALIFTALGAWLLFERRYVWLAPLMFFFVWTYSLFPMLLVAALIWTVIIAWNEEVFEWRPLAYTAGGMVAGNIINPYFPQNLGLFVEHAVTKMRVGDFGVPVGGEWYPYDSKMLFWGCFVSFLAMFVGYILYRPDERKLEEKSTFFLALATIFCVWTFQSKRIAEYFPPLAILFAAFAWQAFANRKTEQTLPEDFQRDLAPYLDASVETEQDEKRDFWKLASVGLLCALLAIWSFLSLHGLKIESRKIEYGGVAGEIAGNDPPERYEKAMSWALQNIPSGERIFNTDWDDFPKMFYHDQKHNYVAGLDPKYLHSRNPELWKFYEEITTGKTEDAAPIIVDKFGARWVFSDNHHDDFYAKAMESGWFDKVYEDEDGFILKIRDAKGEPPAETSDQNGEAAADDAAEPNADEPSEDAEENAPENPTNTR
jgi:hypothetical protein